MNNMLERAAWTFAQAFLAVFVISDLASAKTALVAAAAAALRRPGFSAAVAAGPVWTGVVVVPTHSCCWPGSSAPAPDHTLQHSTVRHTYDKTEYYLFVRYVEGVDLLSSSVSTA